MSLTGNLTILTPPLAGPDSVSGDLTTLANVKARLEITTGAEDDLIKALIASASSTIQIWLNRELGKANVQEEIAGFGGPILMLHRPPIIGSTSAITILQDNTPITDFEMDRRDAGFLRRRAGWLWTPQLWDRGISTSFVMGREDPIFVVTYDGGFWLPSFPGSPGADDILLPAAIEQAAIVTVRDWRSTSKASTEVQALAAADLKVTFARTQSGGREGLPLEARTLIASFKRAA